MHDHLVLEFVQCELSNVLTVSCVYVADVPRIGSFLKLLFRWYILILADVPKASLVREHLGFRKSRRCCSGCQRRRGHQRRLLPQPQPCEVKPIKVDPGAIVVASPDGVKLVRVQARAKNQGLKLGLRKKRPTAIVKLNPFQNLLPMLGDYLSMVKSKKIRF